jgi:hypothetical protein
MGNEEKAPEHLSRPEAIARLRERLKMFVKNEECVCEAVGGLGIFCRGFRALTDEEFRARFEFIAKQRPRATREELEELAGQYHKGRMEVTGAEICCDLETREHVGCDGWNSFENSRLEQIYLALIGSPARIG